MAVFNPNKGGAIEFSQLPKNCYSLMISDQIKNLIIFLNDFSPLKIKFYCKIVMSLTSWLQGEMPKPSSKTKLEEDSDTPTTGLYYLIYKSVHQRENLRKPIHKNLTIGML
jgi:hypothetical protein